MIRIVYVVDNLSFRGGERTFLQLVEGIDRSRYDVSVACTPGGVFVERLERLRVPVIPADMRRRRLDTALSLARILKRTKPHIVHTQGRGDTFGRLAARLAGVPVIMSTTAMIAGRYQVPEWWRRTLYRIIDRITDRLVDRYIVVNRASVEPLTGRHKIPPARIVVIPNGIELKRYDRSHAPKGTWRARCGIPDGTTLVGALGRFTWQKGFSDLLRAFATLPPADDVWLAIGGDGPLREDLDTLARTPNIEDRCLLPGFIDDVPEFLADLDVFVLSSRLEGHPMVLLEAMAMGLPVIATDIAGVGDTVTDGVDGRLIPVGDVPAMANALGELIRDQSMARRFGQNARKKIEREYTVEQMVRRTTLVYEEILAEKGLDIE